MSAVHCIHLPPDASVRPHLYVPTCVPLLLQMGIPLGSTAAAGLTATVAAAAALTELAAADAAVQALRQAAAAGLLLLSAQVRVLVEAFAVSSRLNGWE
jgi:hypothetical protein